MGYTQYTIVIPGNRFGCYLSETLSRKYYTKWQIRILSQGSGNLKSEKISKVRVKAANLSDDEIKDATIRRTREFYDDYLRADGDYPTWLKDLSRARKLN